MYLFSITSNEIPYISHKVISDRIHTLHQESQAHHRAHHLKNPRHTTPLIHRIFRR